MRASEASTREVRLAKPSIRAAAKVMAEVAERDRFVGGIRRLPVVNRSKRLVGILSLGDIAAAAGPDPTDDAFKEVSKPRGPHCQSHHGGTGPPTLR
jgi:CBS domain-containing protein